MIAPYVDLHDISVDLPTGWTVVDPLDIRNIGALPWRIDIPRGR